MKIEKQLVIKISVLVTKIVKIYHKKYRYLRVRKIDIFNNTYHKKYTIKYNKFFENIINT